MKVALITANLGNIDEDIHLDQIVKQDYEFSFFNFHLNSLPFPLPNLDNRTKARYLKIMTHRFLPEYDVYVWIDGRIKIISELFISTFVKHLENKKEFVVITHPKRKSIYEEIEFILHQMNSGEHYLIGRYGHQELRKELEFYKSELYPNENVPLFSSGVLGRLNNEKVNKACDEWFLRSIEFSNFDQAMLSYIIWKHELTSKHLLYENWLFAVMEHNKIIY